jgi:hypothetical protein
MSRRRPPRQDNLFSTTRSFDPKIGCPCSGSPPSDHGIGCDFIGQPLVDLRGRAELAPAFSGLERYGGTSSFISSAGRHSELIGGGPADDRAAIVHRAGDCGSQRPWVSGIGSGWLLADQRFLLSDGGPMMDAYGRQRVWIGPTVSEFGQSGGPSHHPLNKLFNRISLVRLADPPRVVPVEAGGARVDRWWTTPCHDLNVCG